MDIVVKYFAVIRERLGIAEETIQVESGATVQAIYDHVAERSPELEPLLDRSMIMRNHEYAERTEALEQGDEVAIIPPVSGGGHFRVHESKLNPEEISKNVEHPGAGAVVIFSGVVRDNARGRSVSALEYEAYPPAAERQLARIGEEVHERWDLLGVAFEHRYGLLQIGEVSVIIAVSSAHREAAFEAAAYAIHRIKEIVPIWKKEFYDDGETWIGSESDYQELVASERAGGEEPSRGG